MTTLPSSRLGAWFLTAALAWLAAADAPAQQRSTGSTRGTTSAGATRRSTTGATGAGSGSRSYQNNSMIGEATVISDPETRRLIVITDEETSQQVSLVISNLDRPKPQVLIKVVFLELSYNKSSDIGIEGSYKRIFDTTSTGIVNQAFGLAAQGASPVPPGAGIYQVLGKDFQVTLRAIAQAGDAELLSRPSILARNNQQAVITVGQQVPLVTNVRFDSLGNQINSVSYTDVGIILRVTPFIGADGMVEMIVAPETSELADKSQWVPISVGAAAPTINTRSANTVVVTPDGQTVIIGGMMAKAKAESVSKIPLLGDIPYLGAAFRRTIKENRKTELLIFLTPHIVRTQEELALLTARERAGGSIVPRASTTEEDLDRFLDNLPASGKFSPAKTPAPKPPQPVVPPSTKH